MMKDDVTRRVARTMEHVEAQAAEFDHIAVRQPAIRRKAARRRKAVARRRFGQAFDPEQVILVRTLHRHAKLLGEFGPRACMSEMSMCELPLLDGSKMRPVGK